MGAGQIGGIATLLDFDFNNAAGFLGKPATDLHGQYIVYYLSHAMLFCSGVLLEPHIVLTPAVCVYSERYKFDVFGGSHKFLVGIGTRRTVENICVHRGYNNSDHQCSTDNIALLVLKNQFVFRFREPTSEYFLNRVRYGVTYDMLKQSLQEKDEKNVDIKCFFHGWGSRRNGFLLPLLIQLRRMEVKIVDSGKCDAIFNTDNKFLCLKSQPCVNEKYGALCPDDLGSVIECGGYVQGMMTSELVDRPCGAGFLNLAFYTKFIECAIDDSRDAMDTSYLSVPTVPIPTPGVLKVTKAAPTTTQCSDCDPKVTRPKPAKPDLGEILEKKLGITTVTPAEPISTPPGSLRQKKHFRPRS